MENCFKQKYKIICLKKGKTSHLGGIAIILFHFMLKNKKTC